LFFFWQLRFFTAGRFLFVERALLAEVAAERRERRFTWVGSVQQISTNWKI
jgi:hypothetical protein